MTLELTLIRSLIRMLGWQIHCAYFFFRGSDVMLLAGIGLSKPL